MQINQNYDNKQAFLGRKIPRYIYHLTTKSNYEQIREQGYIKMSKDYLSGINAVYFVDWQNFIKRWGGILTGKDAPFLCKETFFKYLLKGKGKRNVCLLRIPTVKLDKNNLRVRSQDMLFDMCLNYQDEYRSHDKILMEKFPHLFNFDCVNNSKKYKSKKHSVEYIYKNTVPQDIVEEIGCAELNLQTCRNKNNLLKFLKNLLFNTSEYKSLKIYNK